MNNKKQLRKEDVKNVAFLLMDLNGNTTTLEIKDELRDMDYFAKQQDVSNLMIEIFNENDDKLDFDFNGRYRTYYFKVDSDDLIEEDDKEVDEEDETALDNSLGSVVDSTFWSLNK